MNRLVDAVWGLVMGAALGLLIAFGLAVFGEMNTGRVLLLGLVIGAVAGAVVSAIIGLDWLKEAWKAVVDWW